MQFELVNISGAPREIGYELGKKFVDVARNGTKIVTNVAKKALPWYIPRFGVRMFFRKYAKKIRESVRSRYPFFDEYAIGFGEGAGVDPLLVYEINAFENLAGRPSKKYKVLSQGCTGIVTKRYVGKTYDYPKDFEDFQFIRIWRFGSSARTISLAHHVIPGTHAGMNSHGVGIVYTYVQSRDGHPENIPTMIVLEAILQSAKSVEDVIDEVQKVERASGANIHVTDGKKCVIIEYAPTRINIREGDVLFATNHFVSDVMKDINLPEDKRYPIKALKGKRMIVSSLSRLARIGKLAHPDITLEEIMRAFKDHHPEPGDDSICRHSPYWHTLSAVIFDVIGRETYAVKGTPCSAEFEKYSFP
ncbi:MAG: C45 family peptidase [Candidatus Korarchaeota archaeon]